jgi:hypothetical protein
MLINGGVNCKTNNWPGSYSLQGSYPERANDLVLYQLGHLEIYARGLSITIAFSVPAARRGCYQSKITEPLGVLR